MTAQERGEETTICFQQESVQKIATAITVPGLATFFGFSVLCLATFAIISNFGVKTLIAVAFPHHAHSALVGWQPLRMA